MRADLLADETAAALAELFCKHGADPNARDTSGNLPLKLARLRAKTRLAAVLESYGTKLFDVPIQLKDEPGQPVAVELYCAFETAPGRQSFQSNAQGEMVIKDLGCGTFILETTRKGQQIEPKWFIVSENGSADPASFVVRGIN